MDNFERFFEKVKINTKTGCWEWTGAKSGAKRAKSGTKRWLVLGVGTTERNRSMCNRTDLRMKYLSDGFHKDCVHVITAIIQFA